MAAEKITVATPRQEVLRHMERIQTVTDLMGGQKAMRAAGERYLHRGKDEPKPKWEARVNGATLLNAYERTLAYLAGQVFSKDVSLGGIGFIGMEFATVWSGYGSQVTIVEMLPRVLPLELEPYLEYHFTKVGQQTRDMLDSYIRLGRQHGLPVAQLQQLRSGLG